MIEKEKAFVSNLLWVWPEVTFCMYSRGQIGLLRPYRGGVRYTYSYKRKVTHAEHALKNVFFNAKAAQK
jgi:hypothetical protein